MAVSIAGATSRYEGSGALLVDSKVYTASIWFNQTELTAVARPVLNFRNLATNISSGISVSNGIVNLTGRNAAGTVILSSASTTTLPTQNQWHNALIAVDLAAVVPTKMYIDGVAQVMTDATIIDDLLHFNTDDVIVGASKDAANAVVAAYTGILDELYFVTSYVNIDVEALRERFYGPRGSQIGLGAGGLNPTRETGVQPDYFLTHGPNNFGRNEGAAGNLSTAIRA